MADLNYLYVQPARFGNQPNLVSLSTPRGNCMLRLGFLTLNELVECVAALAKIADTEIIKVERSPLGYAAADLLAAASVPVEMVPYARGDAKYQAQQPPSLPLPNGAQSIPCPATSPP